jgi:HEPN domain-containing protein
MSLEERKVELILRLYVDPADQDYLTSRWCYHSGIFHSFYWCAAQACEKYLKALVLLRGASAVGYGHNLVALFSDVRQHDHESIIPQLIDLPETTAMGRDAWQGKPVDLYIDYLNKYGSPDNRYAFEGTYVNGPVLHALDALCCAFRRLMRVSNLTGGDLFAYQSVRNLQHGRICDDKDWMIDPNLLLERAYVGRYQVGQDHALRRIFSSMNIAFFPKRDERDENESSFGGHHFHGSPLHNHLIRLATLDPSPENKEMISLLQDWASENIHMSKAVRSRLGLPRRSR